MQQYHKFCGFCGSKRGEFSDGSTIINNTFKFLLYHFPLIIWICWWIVQAIIVRNFQFVGLNPPVDQTVLSLFGWLRFWRVALAFIMLTSMLREIYISSSRERGALRSHKILLHQKEFRLFRWNSTKQLGQVVWYICHKGPSIVLMMNAGIHQSPIQSTHIVFIIHQDNQNVFFTPHIIWVLSFI